MKINAGNIKKGDFLLYRSKVWHVSKTEFSFQGRGLAVVRLKLKNEGDKTSIDQTFKSTEQLERAEVSNKLMQYLYQDGKNLFFMDEENFSQLSLPQGVVGKFANFLKQGDRYYVIMHEDKPLTIRIPPSVKLKVVETEQAVKGDTVSGAKKPAKVETGVTVTVPLFIKVGDVIIINPETGEYVERAKS